MQGLKTDSEKHSVVQREEFNDPSSVEDASNANSVTNMLRVSLWVAFAAWHTTFDEGFSGTVLIMPSYQKAFGTCHQGLDSTSGRITEVCSLTPLQQSLISLNYLFIGVGGALSALTGRYTGRRGAIQIGSLLAVVGAAGMLGTGDGSRRTFLHFMVCKCVCALGLGQLISASLAYGSECIVASKRGLALGIYNVGLAFGNLSAAAVCAGSARLEPDNNWQWKIPILAQIPLGIILGAGILTLPESPRWILNGNENREKDARRALSLLYRIPANSPEITSQINEVKAHIRAERANFAASTWYEIYSKPHLRRTWTSALIMIGLSITGIQFVQPYAALFLKGVGIHDPYLINVIIALCILGGAALGPFIVEYAGRRFAILSGYSTMAVCMLIFSAVSSALGSGEVSKIVVVVFLCLWSFVFGGTIAPSAGLAAVEMHSVRLRTYGQAHTTSLYGIFSFGAMFWTPYMLDVNYGNMGPNVGYFYAAVTVFIGVLAYLLVPETAGLTLEQIDDIFNSAVRPWKTSMSRNKAIIRAKMEQLSEESGSHLGMELPGSSV
ncbi:MFS-type transporter [Penicillium ucsense]|uniref:MFS-type transporter n=1 Tax=Penicillium ucsense TaxID=2839758 RepID=A0A8J8W417_9EURO|nr:MFS-type transporter [Penicillium ucsense]KAF7737429.1 MFS-type transporter [Penicillium ucsense]